MEGDDNISLTDANLDRALEIASNLFGIKLTKEVKPGGTDFEFCKIITTEAYNQEACSVKDFSSSFIKLGFSTRHLGTS